MQSLRTLARAVPRVTSRLASTATRTPFRAALPITSRCTPISRQLPRTFTTSIPRQDDAAQELAAKLTQEIQLESEESSTPADSDTNISAFLSTNQHWTLVDTPNNQEVQLTRQYEDETITVAFSIADFNTPMMEGSGADEEMDDALADEDEAMGVESAQSGGGNTKGAINQGQTRGGNFKVAPEDSIAPADRDELRNEGEDGDEAEEQPAFPANVGVLVQRKGKGALRISLIAENGVFAIQSVTHLPDSKANSSKSASELIRDATETQYTGPPFQQLDEDVQSLLEQYLDVRGINTGLALFVPEYIDVKEQKEYLGWLERVRGFVE